MKKEKGIQLSHSRSGMAMTFMLWDMTHVFKDVWDLLPVLLTAAHADGYDSLSHEKLEKIQGSSFVSALESIHPFVSALGLQIMRFLFIGVYTLSAKPLRLSLHVKNSWGKGGYAWVTPDAICEAEM